MNGINVSASVVSSLAGSLLRGQAGRAPSSEMDECIVCGDCVAEVIAAASPRMLLCMPLPLRMPPRPGQPDHPRKWKALTSHTRARARSHTHTQTHTPTITLTLTLTPTPTLILTLLLTSPPIQVLSRHAAHAPSMCGRSIFKLPCKCLNPVLKINLLCRGVFSGEILPHPRMATPLCLQQSGCEEPGG